MKTKLITILMMALLITSTLSFTIVAPVAASSPSGLVGRWHFDEGTGSIAYDSSGSGNDGKLSGGMFGNALDFDGDNDYVQVPDDDTLDVSTFTLEAWIYPRSIPDTWPRIIHKENYEFDLYLTGTNLAVNIGPGNNPFYSNTGIITLNEWQHVAVTCDGSKVVFYRNNVNVGEHSTSLTADPDVTDLYIGNRGDLARDFDGLIDEVRISNIARTFFDLTHAPTADGNTVALWRFDDSEGTTTEDSSGKGNHGTIIGATWAGPTWTTGLFGSALEFDGVDDYVTVDDAPSLDLTVAFTLEAWVYRDASHLGSLQYVLSKDVAPGVPNSNFNLLFLSSSFLSKPDHVALFLKGLTPAGPATKGTDYWDSGGGGIIGETDVLADGWHHVVGVYTGSELMVFVDGVLDGAVPVTGTPEPNNADLWIGDRKYSPGYIAGIIDEPRIWSRALSQEEIKKHAWGLVGEWDFEEVNGDTAYDSSGFGNDGTIVGASPDPNGRFGSALQFDGDGDYVTIADNPSLDLTQEITVEAWIKVDDFVTYGTNPVHLYVVSKDQVGQRCYGIAVNINYEGYPLHTPGFVVFTTSTPYIVWASEPIEADVWYHIAGTYKASTGELKIYVNGEDSSTTFSSADIFSGTPNLRIGAREYTGWYNYFNGWIDEVRIWSQALVPVKFTQTGLESTATGTIVSVTDPIDLDYKQLPHVIMVKAGSTIAYEFTEIVYGDENEAFKLIDVDPDEPSALVPGTGLNVIGTYVELSPPDITSLVVSPSLVPINTEVTATASYTDPDAGETHSAEWAWGDVSTSVGILTEPDGGPGTVTGTHSYDATGVYRVSLTVTDSIGLYDRESFEYVVVYDPTAGFVTGGGWIYSEPGAYIDHPEAEGKATFGFVSKYQKGKTVPTGQTQFIFHAGDLNFHSTSYDWLVIAGSKAMYRGSGVVNGVGGYTFMLSAIDGHRLGGDGVDKFRIQIWAPGDGLYYDNQVGSSDAYEDPTTAISDGSIVIHTPKTK